MQVAGPTLVERPSGLLVPAHLRTERGGYKPNANTAIALDDDGRRRVLLTNDEGKIIQRAIAVLKARGFAFAVGCPEGTPADRAKRVEDGAPAPCGQLLTVEGAGTIDPGLGCACSRIHFAR